jgi:hypothetical protein
MTGPLMICTYRRDTYTKDGVERFEGYALMNEPTPEGIIEVFDTREQALDAALVLLATPLPALLRF